MVRGYILEKVEGVLNYMHPVEAALDQVMYDLGVIGSTLDIATDLSKGARGISFDAPPETANEFNGYFLYDSLFSSNLKIGWIDPLPVTVDSAIRNAATPDRTPAPDPAPDPTVGEDDYLIPVSPVSRLPEINWRATWSKFAPYIALGGGGLLLYLFFTRRDKK